MKKEQTSSKILSILLSVVMVFTMFPLMAVTSIAEADDGFTKPVSTSGGWEHELDSAYTDGRGTHYVSMQMDRTNFTFMQTKENEKFELTTTFSAVKNDGVNYVILSKVLEVDDGYYPLSTQWSARKDLNSKNETSSPNGAALPGSLSQGYKKQLAQNKLSWDLEIAFQGDGAATYTTDIRIDYKAGPYVMNTKEVNNYTTVDEPIILIITVVDETELIEMIEQAEELIASGELAPEEAQALQALIDQAENNHMTDGTVEYSQDQIDAMTDAIDSKLPIDFTDYNSVLETANKLLESDKVPQEIKDEITAEITVNHPTDDVYACDKENIAYVEEATQALRDIISEYVPEGVGAPNTIPVDESKKETGTWVLDVDGSGSTVKWTSSDLKDSTSVKMNVTKVYLDKTESLNIYNVRWSIETNSSEKGATDYYWRVAGPLSSLALNEKIKTADGTKTPNYATYFDNYNLDNKATADNLLAQNNGVYNAGTIRHLDDEYYDIAYNGTNNNYYKLSKAAHSITLSGQLNDSVVAQAEPYYVIPGLYVGFYGGPFYNTYEFKTYSAEDNYRGSNYNYKGPYKLVNNIFYGPTTAGYADKAYPGFELYVYEKTPLMNAINEAVNVEYNGAANWSDWLQALDDAKDIYNTREVTQDDVLDATNALTNFKFEYNVTFSSDIADTDIIMTESNGEPVSSAESVKNKTVTLNTATIEAVSNSVDYTFSKWSDGETSATRTVEATADVTYTAEFIMNYADYTAVDEALANVPENLAAYTSESVAALNKAIASVTENLPLSQQATVDAYADAINEALANLEIAPASYSQLDAALQAATDIPLDYIQNDEAKETLVELIKEAQNIDRNLDASHQDEINTLANELISALENITVLPADYSALEEALNNASLDHPESYYSEDSLAEYQRALAAAQEAMATKGTDDEYNILGQYIIDKAAQDLVDAIAGLTVNGECYYGALDKAINEAEALDTSDFTEESLEAFNEALANAQAVERGLIADNDGVNQTSINDATQALINATNALEYKPADYSELDRQLAITPDFDENTASAESWAEYQKALKDAQDISRTLTALDQDYIDAVAAALENARENLVALGECYYGDLDEAIAKAEALNEDDYTAESWTAIQTALENAQAVERNMLDDDGGVNQTAINDAAQALNDAIKNAVEMIDVTITNNGEVIDTIKVEPGTTVDEAGILDTIEDSLGENEALLGVYYKDGTEVSPEDEIKYDFTAQANTVDTTDANDTIDKANDIDTTNLSDEATQALEDAISAIEEFLDPETKHPVTDNQNTLDELVDALKDAINDANKETLNNLLDEAKDTDTTGKTDESTDALEDAIANAEDVINNPDATPEEIEEAIKALEDAIAGLEDKADYTDEEAAYDKATDIDTSDLSEETKQALEDAIAAADALDKDLPADEQATVDAVTDALNDAINDANKEILGNLLDDAKNTDTEGKTDESKDALEDAIENAEEILGKTDPAATPEEIEDAIKAIEDAIAGLEDKADYTDEEAAYDKATDIDTSDLSEETKQKIEDAIAAADALDKDLPADEQATVDAVTDALNDAINDANKEILGNLIDDAKDTDTEGKTDSSTDVLEDAIENAEEILGKTDPAATPEEIEEAIKAIEDAIAGLEDKADYTAEQEAYDEIKAIDTTDLTPETKQKIEDAIAQADALDKDLPADEQATVDAVTDALKDAIRDAAADELNNALNEAKDTDTTGKTDASTDALEDAIENAEEILGKTDPAATPEEIEEAIKAIEDAIAGLEDKADYTAEEEAYDKATNIDTSDLSEEAKQALEDAIAAADALDKDLPADEQATVDAVTDALNDAINDANKEILGNLLDDAKDTDTEGKTDSSTDALEDAIENAEEILGKTDPAATPEEIEEAIKAIEDAIAGLEDKADYTDEEAAYDKATDIDTSNLSEETKQALEDAIAAADALDKDLPADEQATVDAVTDALIEAITEAEKEILGNVLDDAKGTDTEGMTPDSVQDLEDAIENAEEVLADPDATPEEIEDAIKAIEDAIAGLTPDKSDLDDLIADAEAINQDDYTDETADDLQDAIDAAKDVINNPDATVEEIKNALDDLQDAIDNLVPDKSDLADKITEAEAIDQDNYTDETADELQDAIDAAKDVIDNPDATVEEIKNAITALDDAIAALELTKIIVKEDSDIVVDRETGTEYTYMVGLTVGANSVAEIKAELENDDTQIIITRNDTVLTDADLVGTGCIVKCVSVKDPSVVYEVATVILYGDVDGDGLVNRDNDYAMVKSDAFFGTNNIEAGSVFFIAADLEKDGVLDAFDYFYQNGIITGNRYFDQSATLYK